MIYGLNLVESITLHDITLHYAESSRAEGFFNCEPLSILTLTTLKYFCIYNGDQSFFQFEIIINVLLSSFRFEYPLNFISLRPYKCLL